MRIAAILISTLVSLCLVELGLYILDWSRPIHSRYDPVLGFTNRENTEGWYVGENRIKITLNSQGMRGPEISESKPSGVYRLAVFGDSYTAGFQVEYGERFTELLEPLLSSCLRKPVEVLNFGVKGHGTAQQLLTYRLRAKRYSPDAVLLMLTEGNDYKDNHPAFPDGNPRPYAQLDNGTVTIGPPRFLPSNLKVDVVNVSRTLQLLHHVYVLGRTGQLFPGAQAASGDQTYREAWAITDVLVSLWAGEASSDGLSFVLAHVPGVVHEDERVRAIALNAGVPFVPLREALQAYQDQTGLDPTYFELTGSHGGHWNAEGHRVVADTLAPTLCAR